VSAALRPPARWTDVFRAHLTASAPAALLGMAVVLAFTWPGTRTLSVASDAPFGAVRGIVMMMLFLPLLYWRGRGGSRPLDQGLPMDDARQEWIRTACGALWAVLTVSAALAVHMVMDTRLRSGTVTYAPGLPVSILAGALGAYLVGAAVLVRTDRPGRALLLALMLIVVLGAVGEPLTRSLMSTHTLTEYAAQTKHVRVPGWGRATLLPLVLGVGAVWVSGLLGRHGGALQRVRARWMPAGPRTRSTPRARPSRTVGPRRAASFGAAAVRQLMALRGRLGWSAAGVVAFYTFSYFRLPMVGPSAVEWSVGVAASFWPALVWLEERSRRADWDESVPVGRVPLRVAHALAGAAWLMAAVVPGAFIHPAGAALPAAALALYLASTAVAALLGRPVLACFIAAGASGIASFALAPEHPLSLAHALAPLDAPNGVTWSAAASLIWIALFATAAGAALHLQARRDRSGRAWIPRLRRTTQPA
jgi:hypothetical protein